MQTFLGTSPQDARRWQEYVEAHSQATNYHRWNWKDVIEQSFGWPTFYLMAEEDGKVQGILPLAWQKSRIFGNFITSLPFFNAGGILANGFAAEQALLDRAIELARSVGAEVHDFHNGDIRTKTTKVTFVLRVEPDQEKMWHDLGTKMRTKVRKSTSFGLTAEFGGVELLDNFYAVFSENMRKLGTPVYGRNFFEEIFHLFPEDTHLCVVRHQNAAVAVSLLSGFRDRIEAVWSSSLPQSLALKPNFFLYWNLLCFAGQRGYHLFDFGRSSVGSGTHQFKVQWGAQTVPLYWDYWLSDGKNLPELNPHNPKYRMAIWLWQRLPLPLTRLIGPGIVRCLP
jgi:FemAB-related protein (PEP-CTERM system-associated)